MSSSSSSSSPSCPKKMITLKSSDGETLEIQEIAAVQSKTLENMIDENSAAANFLEIPTLLNLACQSVADMVKGKTPDEIHKIFNIKSTFTPEEEEEQRRENQWEFE